MRIVVATPTDSVLPPAPAAFLMPTAYRVAGEATPGAPLVPLATMVEELRGLADQLADLARSNQALALEVGQLRERTANHEGQLAAKDETIAALRAQLEQRPPGVEVTQAPPSAPGAPMASERPTDPPVPSGGLWQRVRAALGRR